MASWFQFQKRKAIKESCCYGPSLSFELNTSYTELQVNRVLSQLYPDYAVLRRYLVDYGFLLRDERGLKYEVNPDVHGIES